jgi:CubicO group peptidase (beta-lactamase class C family)
LLIAFACACGGSSPAGTPDAGSLDASYFDAQLPSETLFQRANPDPARVNISALDALIAGAGSQQSDSLIVALGDTIITERYFGNDGAVASIQSVTKSVSNLAVGALIDDGKIASVDQPVSTWYPEWASGAKASATLREVLQMSVGLQDDPNFWSQPDLLAFSRAQALASSPGVAWDYSNESTMLLAGIIKQAAGVSADAFVRTRYFAPLGIRDSFWAVDSAGNVQTPGGLYLTPLDLLRLGRLARDDGNWNGTQIVSRAWLSLSTAPLTSLQPCYGMLWWILRPGCGDTSDPQPVTGTSPLGFFAEGWGGNYIAVIPSQQLIGIRTKTIPGDATFNQEHATAFPDFTAELTMVAAR